MKAIVALVALGVATGAGAARAALLPVVIETLSPAAEVCGIAAPSLESAARRTLENSQWQPDADAGGWLNVRVHVTQTRSKACAARITIRMKAYAKPSTSSRIANARQSLRTPPVVLCAKSGTYSPPKAIFPLEVESAVEHLISECLGSLKY